MFGLFDCDCEPRCFITQVITFDYGMKDMDPISNVRFYCKDDPTTAVRIHKDQVGGRSLSLKLNLKLSA